MTALLSFLSLLVYVGSTLLYKLIAQFIKDKLFYVAFIQCFAKPCNSSQVFLENEDTLL